MWRKIRIIIVGANFILVLQASVWIGDDLLSSQLGPIAEQNVELMPSDTGDTPLTPGWPPFGDQSQILYSGFSDT
jgi:hypothetical protein